MIEERYQQILQDIEDAALKNGRQISDVQLIAVTKNVEVSQIGALHRLGHREFGENRLLEAFDKMGQLPNDCHWHLIGSLQSNKVRRALGRFAMIHSVDTLALAKKISIVSQEFGVQTSILMQVNTSGESSKHGFSIEECQKSMENLISLPNLKLCGLMTMAPLTEDERIIRHCFSSLRKLRDELKEKWGIKNFLHLSMGMSHDYKLAIAEGATLIRIGTALFVA